METTGLLTTSLLVALELMVCLTHQPWGLRVIPVRWRGEWKLATFNPVDMGNVSLSNGNLSANANIDDNVKGTHIPEDVKIYFEFTVDQRGGGGSQSPIVGVCLNDLKMISNADSQQSKIWAYASTGNKIGGGSGYASHGDSLSADDVLGVAVDRANGRIWFSKNAWQNNMIPLMAQTLMQHLQMCLLLEFFVLLWKQ